MKILFANLNSSFLINEKVFPSLGLFYLSAYLKRHGHNDIALLEEADLYDVDSSIYKPYPGSFIYKKRE